MSSPAALRWDSEAIAWRGRRRRRGRGLPVAWNTLRYLRSGSVPREGGRGETAGDAERAVAQRREDDELT